MDYIIRKRIDPDGTYYLVKWSGKTHKHNTWLSLAQLQLQPDSHRHLRTLQQSQPQPKQKTKLIRRPGKPSKSKLQQTTVIKLNDLKITIPCISKQRRHWVFGDRIQNILARNDQNHKYLVQWGQDDNTWENQCEVFQREGRKVCEYFERVLNLKGKLEQNEQDNLIQIQESNS